VPNLAPGISIVAISRNPSLQYVGIGEVIPRQLAPSVEKRDDWILSSGRDPSISSSTIFSPRKLERHLRLVKTLLASIGEGRLIYTEKRSTRFVSGWIAAGENISRFCFFMVL
jgi:hypothetical protein